MKDLGILWTVVYTIQLCWGQDEQESISLQWQNDIRPKRFKKLFSKDYQSFSGILKNDSSNINADGSNEGDYFLKILYSRSNANSSKCLKKTNLQNNCPDYTARNLLVAGKNILYKLNASNLELKQSLRWYPHKAGIDNCIVKGRSVSECQNYINILLQYKADPRHYLICGTNAYNPKCREYDDVDGSFTFRNRSERSGIGVIPYSYKHKEHVYFFFRENAVEHENESNRVVSRVARVCKNDKGGSTKSFRYSWTSFLKTILNCSVPGKSPFYFNEIQSVSKLVHLRYGVNQDIDYIFYATFTTAGDGIEGSAVCAFSLQDVTNSFNGKFKERGDQNSSWQSVSENRVPLPRPGSCMNDSKTLSDSYLSFMKKHSIMDESVCSFLGAPIAFKTGISSPRFISIAVDPQILTTAGKAYDLIFIGTTDGRILKVTNVKSPYSKGGIQSIVIEELQLFSSNTTIKQLEITNDRNPRRRLVVMTDHEIRSIPVNRCDRATSCEECVTFQDPYCAWDVKTSRCRSRIWTSNMEEIFIQSISEGDYSFCPNKNCYTKEGHTCVFPFKYDGKEYKSCYSGYSGYWCPYTLTSDGSYNDWDWCETDNCSESSGH